MLRGEYALHRFTGSQTPTFGHRGVSFIGLREQTDDHEHHGGRKNSSDRGELHHNYRLSLLMLVAVQRRTLQPSGIRYVALLLKLLRRRGRARESE
jgi:hypothetical protein